MPYQEYISFAYDNPQDIEKNDFVPVIELTQKEKERIKWDNTSAHPFKDKDFHCEYVEKEDVSTADFEVDEVLETLGRCPICNYKFDPLTLSDEQFKQNLCNYLDLDKQNTSKYFIFLHRRGEIEITFDVKKGRIEANDPDGYIEVMVTPKFLGIEILSSVKIETAYNEQITVKLKVKDEKDANGNWINFSTEIFHLNFFASDNDGSSDDDKPGETKGVVHCGQFVIVSRNCICEDWKDISTVIPVTDFVAWNSSNDTCYQKAVTQIGKVSYKDGVGWNPTSKDLFQIYKDAVNNADNTINQADQINDLDEATVKRRLIELIDFLKNDSLNNDMPLIAGVDHKAARYNKDYTTDHFVVIVGMGQDADGCYLLFYDNAVSNRAVGASTDNKLYFDCKNYLVKGSGDSSNSYISGSSYGEYTITHIRKSSKIT